MTTILKLLKPGLPAVGRSVCFYKFHEFGDASPIDKTIAFSDDFY
jgi:hypothetical protein